MNPAEVPVPAGLLLPMLAVDGRVEVTIALRVSVPVPDDPSVSRTLADLLDAGEVVDMYVSPRGPGGGGGWNGGQ